MSGDPWSDEDDAVLRDGVAKGLTARQISDTLLRDRTRNAVIGRVHRLGMIFPSTRLKRAGGNVIRLPKPKPTPRAPRVPAAPTQQRNVVRFVDKVYPVSSNPLPLSRLPANGCRFPVRRSDEGEWCMCAQPRTRGFYCEEHHDICHQPTRVRAR